jgi:membrane-bound lytic murein transglycosylase MltF
MELKKKQIETLEKIKMIAPCLGIDPKLAAAIAFVESSLGMFQLSKTGARGVYQLTSIAMKDLLIGMEEDNDDIEDIACGILFIRKLLRRHKGDVDKVISKYCDPNDRGFYVDKVKALMKELP